MFQAISTLPDLAVLDWSDDVITYANESNLHDTCQLTIWLMYIQGSGKFIGKKFT